MNICTIEGCQKKREAQGLCQLHRWRLRHYGDVNHYPYRRHCTVNGCNRPHRGKGLCNIHRLRMRRTGTTDEPILVKIASHRYKLKKMPGHPLAHATTERVYLHRAVLFESLGFDWVPCFWCGRRVRFKKEFRPTEDSLLVDHRDHNRHNNDERNLVPACISCNPKRRFGMSPLASIYRAGD